MKIFKNKIESICRFVLLPYFALVYILTVFYGWEGYVSNHSWRIGDWLINYSGGFIRRGLVGEIVHQIYLYTNVAPGLYVLLLQLLFYFFYFIFSFLLLRQQKSIIPYILLVFSPFIFTFQLHGVSGGYRKEIIYFAILAFIVWSARNNSDNTSEIIILIMISIYPLIILSHEMLAVFLPYMLVVYVFRVGVNINIKSIFVIVMVCLSLICFVISIIKSGTEEQVIYIYSSLGGYAPVKDGAISWLSNSATFGRNSVLSKIHEGRYLETCFIVLALCSLAYIPVIKKLRVIFRNKLNLLLLLISIFGTIPLLIYALDWGRILYIHLVSLFMISLLQKNNLFDCEDETRMYYLCNNLYDIGNNKRTFYYMISLVFIIFYSLFWHLPHVVGWLNFGSSIKYLNIFYYIK